MNEKDPWLDHPQETKPASEALVNGRPIPQIVQTLDLLTETLFGLAAEKGVRAGEEIITVPKPLFQARTLINQLKKDLGTT